MTERPILFSGDMVRAILDANPWVWVVGFKTAAVGNEAAQAVMGYAA